VIEIIFRYTKTNDLWQILVRTRASKI